MIMAFLFLAFGIIAMLISGSFSESNSDSEKFPFPFFLGLVFLVGALAFSFNAGKISYISSEWGAGNLETNSVYEIVISTPTVDSDGTPIYAAILRDQEGGLLSRKFMELPPSIFKKTRDEKSPYKAFP